MSLTQAQINFCNQQIRPLADALAVAYRTYLAVKQNWDANGYSTAFPRDATAVPDGAPTDGRQPITDNDVNGIMDVGFNIKSWLENTTTDGTGTVNNANRDKVLKVAVNGGSKV